MTRGTTRARAVVAGLLWLAACARASAQEPKPETPPPSWLESKLTNWNVVGAPVPRAPKPEGDPASLPRCQDQVRPAASYEDRLVVAAGWTLVGPLLVWGQNAVLTGYTGVDGMCRPLGYQIFVFADGRFTGTLSPVPMNSRTDGAAQAPELFGSSVRVAFSRYGPNDPLCCPSHVDTLGFHINRGPKGPVLAFVGVVERGPAP